MSVAVRAHRIYLHDVHTRIPFRYGIARMTDVPHLFLQLECEVDGQACTGVSADNLIPKWFTKNPGQSYRDEVDQMLAVIRSAAQFAGAAGRMDSVFALWQHTYSEQKNWGEAMGYPALLWNFGVSLVERAVLDAFCRAQGQTLFEALQNNSVGIRLEAIHPELVGLDPANLLPDAPLERITLRQTIGMADALADADIPPGERVADGLPESLEANIVTYGAHYFKIKVSGQPDHDRARLVQIREVIVSCGVEDYAFTLDGNEQFKSAGAWQRYWTYLQQEQSLTEMFEHLIFVEQPLHRSVALDDETQARLLAWEARPPTIIDESDSQLHSLQRALDCGYAGTSHKNCKGLFKSIANACLLTYRCEQDPGGCFILSGEDLANIGPVALNQDLAAMSILGIPHVERNGHHYFRGLSMFPDELQNQVVERHPDLYTRHPEGYAHLRIDRGMLSVGSLLSAPFGYALDLDLSCRFTPQEEWDFAALGIFADEYG